MNTETLAKYDKIGRKAAAKMLPSKLFSSIYSHGRKFFLDNLVNEDIDKIDIPIEKNVVLWDLHFANRIFNAAGMFKTADGYELAYRQGAGAFIAGTTTGLPRDGNVKMGITHPFIPLPHSSAAINWMGLPNPGHIEVAKKLSAIPHRKSCPIGVSVGIDPEISSDKALKLLIEGIEFYDLAGACFIELNESCPNVPHGDADRDSSGLDKHLLERMQFVYENFLKKRNRNLPFIIKLSNDTDISQIEPMIDAMLAYGFDGLNLGNTSVKYNEYSSQIAKKDIRHFEYFTREFGGGLSGNPLKANSLELAKYAAKIIKNKNLQTEFHIIRTGGIESKADLIASDAAGISLNQWFTGYFEAFSQHGHNLYRAITSY